jgi:transposase
MREKSNTTTSPSERLVKNIRRATRKHYSAEEKIRIVLAALPGPRQGRLECSEERKPDSVLPCTLLFSFPHGSPQ